MRDYFQLILIIVCTPFTVMWLYFAVFREKKYRKYTRSGFAKEFQMSELFCVGFSVMSLLHVNSTSRKAKIKIKEIAEIKGKKYAEYYYCVMEAAKYTYAYTILLVAMLLAVLADSVEAMLLGILIAGLIVAYLNLSLQDKLSARRQEILMDLPQVLSKLRLLVNSGMVLRDAWKRTAVTGTRTLYREMCNTSLEIENGVMETEAYNNFADRCGVKEVRKFTSMITQNLQKGNEELARFLGDMADEMWEIKKNEVRQKGEKANSKLLFPVLMIFIGILILVLVPVMNGMG
ncbi:MAG: type II secretion system F family protein [Lachnospiraceae bacterium]|nr:type II secretion system F family protein [Lachnospiraceae bacterium]MDY5556009.1 type II secretion system F family protein [Blautia sp.]